jgi:exopolysaccharide biosynthesis polyprenyl glycosylphosphotransferase
VIRRHATELRALMMAADAAVAIASLVVLSVIRFGGDWAIWWREVIPQPPLFVGLYAVTWVVVLAFHGLYRPRARWSLRGEALDVLRATVTMAVITFSVLFLSRLPDVSRLFLLTLFPAQLLATIAIRGGLRVAFENLRRLGYNVRYVLVLGAGPSGRAFASRLESHRSLGLRIVGFLDDDPDLGGRLGSWAYLGGLDRLETVLHDRVVDEVAVCLPLTQWKLLDAIVGICEEEGKITRIPVDFMERTISRARVEDLDGLPVFSLVSGPDRAFSLAVKRTIDLLAGAVGIVALSPLLIVCAVALVLDDGTPVLFHQRRVGLHGRSFTLLKFRSMSRDAESRQEAVRGRNELAGQAFKLTDDPRVTRVGRWLRRTSLDELPQLWNVVRGEMSLVGPRPPLPDEVSRYDIWHRRRLSMKPGMTGLWQVRGRRDPDFDHWVNADLEYIDRWSLWLDLRILARTIPAALQGR